MSGHGDAAPTHPRTDLILAAIFFVFGAAIMVASAAMPTFTDQGTPIFVAPGIVPAFHGAMLAILSVVLALRSFARGIGRRTGGAAPDVRRSIFRTALATVLAVAFAAGLIGRLPFWLAAAIFVFCFINAFEFERGQPARLRLVNAGIALAIGIVTGVGITLLFERLFLIRMP
jgi:hypothetical protein